MHKEEKKLNRIISHRTMTLGCGCLGVLLLLIGLTLFALDSDAKLNHTDMTVSELELKVQEALSQYDYALSTLDTQVTTANEGVVTSKYILSSTRETKERTYVALNDAGMNLTQCWDYDKEALDYRIYVHDNVRDVWVETFYDSEPVSGTPWDVFTSFDNYILLEETENWYDSDDECYVLQAIAQTEEYDTLYEEIYIRKDDFIPIGVITYGVSDSGEDKVLSGDDISIGKDLSSIVEEENIKDIEVEVPTYNESVQMYTVTFSNEDLALFEVPETFLTEEEYMELVLSEKED